MYTYRSWLYHVYLYVYMWVWKNIYIFNMCVSLIKLTALIKIDLIVSILPSYPKRKTFFDYLTAAVLTHFAGNTVRAGLNRFVLAPSSSTGYIFVEETRWVGGWRWNRIQGRSYLSYKILFVLLQSGTGGMAEVSAEILPHKWQSI